MTKSPIQSTKAQTVNVEMWMPDGYKIDGKQKRQGRFWLRFRLQKMYGVYIIVICVSFDEEQASAPL